MLPVKRPNSSLGSKQRVRRLKTRSVSVRSQIPEARRVQMLDEADEVEEAVGEQVVVEADPRSIEIR